jgi:peptide/nickel transport system permease protein
VTTGRATWTALRSLLVQLVVMWALLSWLGIALVRAMPGDPLEFFLATDGAANPADLAMLRHGAGLDDSITTQWWRFWTSGSGAWRVLLQDPTAFGFTRAGEPVWSVVFSASSGGLSRLSWSLLLTVPPFVLAMACAATTGVWLGRRDGKLSRVVMAATTVIIGVPPAVLALLLVWVVVVSGTPLHTLGAYQPGTDNVLDMVTHAALPWFIGALTYVPTLLRTVLVRAHQVWQSPHVMTARGYGASEWRIALVSVMPVVLPSLLAVVAAWLPALVGGAVLLENVFAWPGLGRLQVEALQRRDVWLAVLIMLVLSTVALVGTRLLDAARVWIDPRAGGR